MVIRSGDLQVAEDSEMSDSQGSEETSDSEAGEEKAGEAQPSTSGFKKAQRTGTLSAGEIREAETTAIDALLEGGRENAGTNPPSMADVSERS